VPAIADIDNDGMKEIVVGTGGFSSDSGRLLFYKNTGSGGSPEWTEMNVADINIGNDAAVTIVDYNFDNKPDIIAGNSEGKIFFFKNASKDNNVRYIQDRQIIKKTFGMYAVPAAVKMEDRVILAVGNSMGRLYFYELRRKGKGISARSLPGRITVKSFASPSFVDLLDKGRFDLVVSDSDGEISYFENLRSDFSVWRENKEIFNKRIFAGPASAPVMSSMYADKQLVIGNIDGILRLYEYRKGNDGLPWVEIKNHLSDVKVTGFSRGILTKWDGREIVITGQSSGEIRAFINNGSRESPLWDEHKEFFAGIHIKGHSTPAVFDIDNDGMWEIITGAVDGRIYAYRVNKFRNGVPQWERIRGLFDHIKVKGFSSPAMVKDDRKIYLFVGRQDGGFKTYTASLDGIDGKSLGFYEVINRLTFQEKSFLQDIMMTSHSSPSLVLNSDDLEFVAGDYDGNIRHFMCEKKMLTATRKKSS
jgi:hypothetical protein